jgi:hypothetical protein
MGIPFLLPFRVARLPTSLLANWEESPFELQQSRAAGLAKTQSKSWRRRNPGATTGGGSVLLASINHPRVVAVDLWPMLTTALHNVLWSQGLSTTQGQEGTLQVPGGVARAFLVRIAGGVAGQVFPSASTGVVASSLPALPPVPMPPDTPGTGVVGAPPPPGATGLPALPPPLSVVSGELVALALAWNLDGVNDFLYVGVARDPDAAQQVTQAFPAAVEYVDA